MSTFKFSVSRLGALSKSPEPIQDESETTIESQQQQQQQQQARHLYSKSSQSVELTQNESYKVSQLSSLPHIFTSDPDSIRESYTDAFTKHAVAITDNMVYIWKYDSNDITPITINFPIQVGAINGELPKVVLCAPLPDLQDPGLLIIDTISGIVKYYETIYSAPAAGILHSNKILEFNLRLKGERVRYAKFIPNSGVFITTSTNRVILLTLTNRSGESSLSATDVLSSNRSILSGLFFNSNTKGNNNDSYSNNVISITEGKFFNHGIQQIIIQESDGNLSVVEFGLVSGVSIAFQQNIKTLLLQHVSNDENYLNLSSFKVLDIQPVLKVSNQFIVLVSVDNSLLLYLIEIDENGVLIKSANRIRSHKYSREGLNKLFVPPEFDTTVFILSGNTLILTNAAVYESSKNQTWEEYISIKPNVKILGVGSEINENAVNIITRESGILKAEVLPNLSKKSDQNTVTLVDSFSFIKSRIEQAILFDSIVEKDELNENSNDEEVKMDTSVSTGQENPLQFDLNLEDESQFSQFDIQNAINSVVSELLNNKSSCIKMGVYVSVLQHLTKRSNLMTKLTHFVAKNFGKIISEEFKAHILTNAVKLNLALQFYAAIYRKSFALNKVENHIVKDLKVSSSVENFFLECNDSIIELLSIYFKSFVVTEELNANSEIALITFKNGFLDVEHDVKETLQIQRISSTSAYLLITKGICAGINNLLAEFTTRNREFLDDIETSEYHNIASGLSLFVYYTIGSSLAYFNYHSGENNNVDSIKKYTKFFHDYRYNLILIFIVLKQQDLILDYAVSFSDYQSICEILESERAPLIDLLNNGGSDLNVIEKLGLESRLEKVYNLFDQFYHQLGRPFADTVYNFYINEGQIKLVLFGFENFEKEGLDFFFEKNREYDYFSWLRPLFSRDYELTSSRLLNSFENDNSLNYDNKKLQLSIAKLSLIVHKSKIHNADELERVDERLYNISAGNALIDLEKDIHENLIAAFTELNDSNIAKMIHESNVFKLSGSDSSSKFKILKSSLAKLENRDILSIVEIIDILTLIEFNKFSNIENFYDGFKLSAIFANSKTWNDTSPKLLDFIQLTLWRRLLLFTNWDELIKKFTNDPTEQELRLFLDNLPIFKCFQKMAESQYIDFYDPNNSLIKIPNFNNFNDLSIQNNDWKLIGVSNEFYKLFNNDEKLLTGYITDIKEEEESLRTLINVKDIGKWVQKLLNYL